MKSFALSLAAALLATTAGAANAASIGLSTNYSVGYATTIEVGEAGAVTYHWDSDSLMVFGDEVAFGAFNAADGKYLEPGKGPAYLDPWQYAFFSAYKYKDTEGIAYMGNNTWVLAQERTEELNKFAPNGNIWPAEKNSPNYCINFWCDNIGNEGVEGVTWDRRTGDFYAIKETNSQKVWKLTGVDFAGNGTTEELFDPALLGLQTLSDISVLSNSDAFWGTAMGDNLLILSTTSEMLLEVTKAGEILSRFDLKDVPVDKIEGVTVDNAGNIYLVGENSLVGFGSGLIQLKRNVATPAVPEPATWAMMMGGLGLAGAMMRRRRTVVVFA